MNEPQRKHTANPPRYARSTHVSGTGPGQSQIFYPILYSFGRRKIVLGSKLNPDEMVR